MNYHRIKKKEEKQKKQKQKKEQLLLSVISDRKSVISVDIS
jgi:hypothetical protein